MFFRQAEAARLLGLCERQVRRILARYRAEGDAGLVHRLRGRPSNRRVPQAVAAQALARVAEVYHGFGPTLVSEKLAERDGLSVSRERLRRQMIGAGLSVRLSGARPPEGDSGQEVDCWGEANILQYERCPSGVLRGAEPDAKPEAQGRDEGQDAGRHDRASPARPARLGASEAVGCGSPAPAGGLRAKRAALNTLGRRRGRRGGRP